MHAQSEAKLTRQNGQPAADRDWTPPGHKYYLEPGTYEAILRAPGHFDVTHNFFMGRTAVLQEHRWDERQVNVHAASS